MPGAFAYTPAAGTVLSAGTQTLSVTFTPTDAKDYNPVSGSVSVTVGKATPSITAWPAASGISYGQTLASSTLSGGTASVAGSFAWTTPATAPGAGTQSERVTFTPADATDYNPVSGSVSVTVSKATPSITAWPAASGISYGQTLASSTLSGGTASVAGSFAWTTPTTAPGAGTQLESVTFTPSDATDYNPVTGSVSVTVSKATPSITAWPTASGISYGQTLASSTLSGGTASVAGSFAWTTPATAPGAGTASESVTFTPADATDYNPVSGAVSVTVSKATPSITAWPAASGISYGQTLASSTLTGGTASVAGTFAWTTPATAPAAGTASESVTFTPTDAKDYNPVSGSVSVTVSKATPSITAWPAASGISYGQTLASSTLSGGTASVAGTFAWTTPATAPGAGTQSESVTFTPTASTNYTTVVGSVSVTVSPSQCTSNGYSYQRAIVIDHTKVPNTDQANFPFLFSITDPLLATTANSGHVASPNGYDIIFTSDPAGQNILSYEMEEYDPVHGQVIAWVGIPTLSHTTDTVIYMFYSNSGITASQQNPAGVWDANYMGVWHVANNGGELSLADSTSNGNNATNDGATATTGQIDGGMQTNGSTYATIGTPASLANLAQGNATFSAWVNSASGAGIIMGKDDNNDNKGWALSLNASNYVDFVVVYGSSNFSLTSSVPVTIDAAHKY